MYLTVSMIMLSVVVAVHAYYIAGKKLHWKLLHSVLRGKMVFFDSKPLGMILNRFSKDIDVIGKYIEYYLAILDDNNINGYFI